MVAYGWKDAKMFESVTVLRLLLSEFQPDVKKLISLHQAIHPINNKCEENELCYYGYW